ncbi:MAG: DUF4386 domain-containing protein [Weeksellaceae bacterium]|nr:DUF4386 domain-containing protein [Weeksellaceae bacterium]
MIKNKNALFRMAGALYLIVILTGLFSLMYVPKMLFVWDNPAKTAENIAENTRLFRFSIASSVLCYVAFTLLPVFLYQLLRSVHELSAKLMLILALVSVPLSVGNLQNKYGILHLLTSKSANEKLIQARVMDLLHIYDNGILIATVFWGLWLLPFGFLVYKSGFLPKIIGIFLMLGCFGYLINFFGNTLSAEYQIIGISSYLGLLPTVGELSICAWLLFGRIRKHNI